MRKVNVRKAIGQNNIAPETMEWMDNDGNRWLHEICNEVRKVKRILKN